MYKVELAVAPRQFYAVAGKPARCFHQLQTDPRRHNNIKPLKGQFAGLLRFRGGDWRVIYRISAERNLVYILDIAHRSNVYE